MTDFYEKQTQELYDDTSKNVIDPFEIFKNWQAKAEEEEINDPGAMTLATVDENGRPDARILLLKGFDSEGFVFYTNLNSSKGQQLAVNPVAAMLFHWKTLRRQVRIRGAITQVSNAEADAYFASRPRGSQIGAHASNQSHALASRADLIERTSNLTKDFDEENIPRPAHWSGFRLVPDEIEFWKDGESRLHDRMLFLRKDKDRAWTSQRLSP